MSVLYWNYYETVNRRLTKRQGIILDHWGKGAPTKEETDALTLSLLEMNGILSKEKIKEVSP